MICADRDTRPFLTRFLCEVAKEIEIPETDICKVTAKSDTMDQRQGEDNDEQ